MNDDLEYLRSKIPEFPGYADAQARHGADERVRACIGSELATVSAKLEPGSDQELAAELDALIVRCQFADQEFVRSIQQEDLSESALESLAKVDRALVELAVQVMTASPPELPPLLSAINEQFDRRRVPLPA